MQLNSLTRSTYSYNQNVPPITRHLLSNSSCANAYNSNIFIILAVSNSELQLSALDALYTTEYQPTLCNQKNFYNLLSFNPNDYTATKPDLIQEK